MLGYRLHQGGITNLFKAVKVKLNNMGAPLDWYGMLRYVPYNLEPPEPLNRERIMDLGAEHER